MTPYPNERNLIHLRCQILTGEGDMGSTFISLCKIYKYRFTYLGLIDTKHQLSFNFDAHEIQNIFLSFLYLTKVFISTILENKKIKFKNCGIQFRIKTKEKQIQIQCYYYLVLKSIHHLSIIYLQFFPKIYAKSAAQNGE